MHASKYGGNCKSNSKPWTSLEMNFVEQIGYNAAAQYPHHGDKSEAWKVAVPIRGKCEVAVLYQTRARERESNI